MSLTKTYDFNTAGDYNYNSTDIEVTGGVAKLKLQDLSGQTLTEDFASDSGFTYDSLVEFSGGQLQQVSQANANELVYANYASSATLDRGTGTLTATLTGEATVADGVLKLVASTTASAKYDNSAGDKFSASEVFIRFDYIPQYSGGPAAQQDIFTYGSGTSNNIRVAHLSNSNISILVYDGSGTSASIFDTGFAPTAGQTYDMALSINWSTGVFSWYRAGVRRGTATIGGTPSLSNAARDYGFGLSGSSGAPSSSSNFHIDNFEILEDSFDDLPLSSKAVTYAYQESFILSPSETLTGSPEAYLQSIDSFTPTATGSPKYTLNTSAGVSYYWNGAAWVTSNESYSQANTAAEITTNFSSFSPEIGLTFRYGIVFQNANTQGLISNLSIGYTHQAYSTNDDVIAPINANRFITDGVSLLAETVTLGAANTAVQYIINVNGTKKYWDGAAWSNSNGTFAQSNTLADFNTNISSLTILRQMVGVDVILRSTDGQYTPQVDELTFTYSASLPDVTLPTLVDVNGYFYDHNAPIENLVVYIRPYSAGFNNMGSVTGIHNVYDWATFGTTSSEGYISSGVFLQTTNNYWEFKIGKKRYKVELPNQDNVDFATLTLEAIED